MPDTPAPAAGLLRSLFACAGSGGAVWGLAIAARHLAVAAVAPGAGVDDIVAAAVVTLGASAAAVLCFGCSLLVIGAAARLAGRTWCWCDAAAARVTPAVVRRAVTVTVTTGLGLTAVAGTASATEIDLGWATTDERTTVADVAERTTASEVPQPNGAGAGDDTRRAPPAEAPSAPSSTRSSDAPEDRAQVTVRSGDSLWTIARAHLDQPSDADIATEWPRWYAANRDVIGPDPDLIHPGQVLVVPTDEELR